MDLSEKIKQLREKKEISLSKLAETAGISKAYLSQLENNVSKQPSGEVFVQNCLGTWVQLLLIFLTSLCAFMQKTSERCRMGYAN